MYCTWESIDTDSDDDDDDGHTLNLSYYLKIQWASQKKGYHTIFNSYRRLGTEVIFTYYENNLGRILNNITFHGSIKRNRCQPWQE